MKNNISEMKFVKRFSLADRRLHWYFALGFIILLVTGIIMYFIGSKSGSPQKVSHLLGGMIFFFVPIIYLIKVKDKKNWLFIFSWNKLDLEWFKSLFSRKKVEQGKYNSIQKFSLLVVVIIGILASITGVILIFAPTETMILLHNISTIILGTFFVLHGILYLIKPYRRALRSMIKGIMDVNYAKEHHELWFEKVKHTAFSPKDGMKPNNQLQNEVSN